MFSFFGKIVAALLAGLLIAAERSCSKLTSTTSHIAERAAPKASKIEIAAADAASASHPKRIEPRFDPEVQGTRSTDGWASVVSGNGNKELRTRATLYFSATEERVLQELLAAPPPVTVAAADKIIRSEVSKAIVADTQNLSSPLKFEVLSGKLKVDGSKTLLGVDVSFGEVNVYKVSLTVAGFVAACNGLIFDKFKPCVELALKRAEGLIVKEIEPVANVTPKK